MLKEIQGYLEALPWSFRPDANAELGPAITTFREIALAEGEN